MQLKASAHQYLQEKYNDTNSAKFVSMLLLSSMQDGQDKAYNSIGKKA